MQAAITDDPQKPWHASWRVQLAYQAVLTLAAATLAPSDRTYAAPHQLSGGERLTLVRRLPWRNRGNWCGVDPSDSVSSAPAPVLRLPLRLPPQSVAAGQEDAGGLGHSRILSSLASYIDKGRYYWSDRVRYSYLDAGQYNLLGVETYFWKQYCYLIWHGFPQSGGPYRSIVNPFVDSFCPIWTDQPEAGNLHAWPTSCSPGDYIDRGLYYGLDQWQYYYLEEGQYNLLGGFGYVLGHPCSAMWYDYHPYLWGTILAEAIRPPHAAVQERVDFYGKFTILGEPAQIGDVLQAFVSADGIKRIRVWTTFETFNLQLSIFNCQWGAWDESAARWYPVGLTRSLAKWTAHGVCPDLIGVNAVPEPSTIALLTLGALMIRRYDKWQTRSRKF